MNKKNAIIKQEFIRESRLIQGECLAVMDELIAEGVVVDAIITDPPYQMTACKWDSLIPFNKHIMTTRGKSKKLIPMYEDEWVIREAETTNKPIGECRKEFKEKCKEGMWDKLNKLIKPNGVIVLFGLEPFSSSLRMSNIENYKYDWKWDKMQGGGFLNSKKKPLTSYEDIIIFATTKIGNHVYNPQLEDKEIGRIRPIGKRKEQRVSTYGKRNGQLSKDYNNKKSYPKDIIKQSSKQKECNSINRVHQTQKPVTLMEYLIKTYTNENELVLDFTAGSFSTLVACDNLNRRGIGIELDEGYYNIGKERLGG